MALENEDVKLLWDFSIQTDHTLEHNKPDIDMFEEVDRQVQTIYFKPDIVVYEKKKR